MGSEEIGDSLRRESELRPAQGLFVLLADRHVEGELQLSGEHRLDY